MGESLWYSLVVFSSGDFGHWPYRQQDGPFGTINGFRSEGCVLDLPRDVFEKPLEHQSSMVVEKNVCGKNLETAKTWWKLESHVFESNLLHPIYPAGWAVCMSSQSHGKRHISVSVLCDSVTRRWTLLTSWCKAKFKCHGDYRFKTCPWAFVLLMTYQCQPLRIKYQIHVDLSYMYRHIACISHDTQVSHLLYVCMYVISNPDQAAANQSACFYWKGFSETIFRTPVVAHCDGGFEVWRFVQAGKASSYLHAAIGAWATNQSVVLSVCICIMVADLCRLRRWCGSWGWRSGTFSRTSVCW